jgi:Ca2+-binding RTX toxin-like protein
MALGRCRAHERRRAALAAAAIVVIWGVSAGPAWSATAERFGETVYYRADGGERNNLDVRGGVDSSIVFHDVGATIRAGEGCEVLADGGVACGAGLSLDTAPRKIDIRFGDRDDRAGSEIGSSRVTDIEMHGGRGKDTLHSGSGIGGFHSLFGGPGDDELSTATNNIGRSTFVGGAGDDVLTNGEGGLAWFYGGPGDDELRMAGQFGAPLLMDGGRGADLYFAGTFDDPSWIVSAIRPGAGRDTLSAATAGPLTVNIAACGGCVENVIGSPNDDSIVGDDGKNVLLGGLGNDVLDPRGGRDQVAGEAGDDQIDLRDAQRDGASCGDGVDRVDADAVPADSVASDCEEVVR